MFTSSSRGTYSWARATPTVPVPLEGLSGKLWALLSRCLWWALILRSWPTRDPLGGWTMGHSEEGWAMLDTQSISAGTHTFIVTRYALLGVDHHSDFTYTWRLRKK